VSALLALPLLLVTASAQAALPQGYFVWSKGTADDGSTRKLHRLTLPEKTDERTLTEGEDVEPSISPDGKWVAYAKAKFPGGSDYHDFKLWKVYLVSIHGIGAGRREIKIDDDGAWPSWSKSGALLYNQADGTHSRVVRVELDDRGRVTSKQTLLATKDAFGAFTEANEAQSAPDESWLAVRTRGNATQNGVSAFTVNPPSSVLIARAGTIGCMPVVDPNGNFALIAGATEGIRWGHGPQIATRKEDQLLIPPRTAAHKAYHPGISSDGRWVLNAQGTDADHNAGHYDVSIFALDPAAMTISDEQTLASGDFNGWPRLWVGAPAAAPPPVPEVSDFFASSYTVAPGEMVELSWSTFGADQVLLDGAAVAADGTQQVTATATATHTLLAQSTVVSAKDSRALTITVNPTPLPVTIEQFVAQPDRLERGRSTVLTWQVRNATTLDLDGLRAPPTGSREVTPLETKTYVLTAQGANGPVQATVTITVEAQKSGLLPDRGGFRCSLGSGGTRGAMMFAMVAVAVLVARRRRSRRIAGVDPS
jgi:hypothetical protein